MSIHFQADIPRIHPALDEPGAGDLLHQAEVQAEAIKTSRDEVGTKRKRNDFLNQEINFKTQSESQMLFFIKRLLKKIGNALKTEQGNLKKPFWLQVQYQKKVKIVRLKII